MDIIVQILVSGLTMGSIYAIGTIALSLLWGAMGMLNLAHGSFIAIGGLMAAELNAAIVRRRSAEPHPTMGPDFDLSIRA